MSARGGKGGEGAFPLKTIHAEYAEKAIERAERYRLLNWPEEAESICLDVLAADRDNQHALVVLVLALSDQLTQQSAAPRTRHAKKYIAKLSDPYQRAYLTGILHEREGRAQLARGFHGSSAYGAFREAMEFYEEAEKIKPEGNEEALLRYNSCVRTIERERLGPSGDEGPESMLE